MLRVIAVLESTASGSAPQDVALLLLRLVFGLFLVPHGLNKAFGRGGTAATANWFASIGMRWPRTQARLAAAVEIVAGAMFAAGLLLPLAAAGMVGVMVVAIVVAHRRVGFFIFKPGQGWEYTASIVAAAVAVAVAGPGRWSIDHAIGITSSTWGGPWASGVIAAALGAAVAAAQLAVCYRPERAR